MSSQILDCAGARRFSSFGAVLIPTGRGGNDSSRSRARCVIVPLWDGRIIIPQGRGPFEEWCHEYRIPVFGPASATCCGRTGASHHIGIWAAAAAHPRRMTGANSCTPSITVNVAGFRRRPSINGLVRQAFSISSPIVQTWSVRPKGRNRQKLLISHSLLRQTPATALTS